MLWNDPIWVGALIVVIFGGIGRWVDLWVERQMEPYREMMSIPTTDLREVERVRDTEV